MRANKAAILKQDKCIRVQTLPANKLCIDECEITIDSAGICSSDIARGYGGGAYFYPLTMGHELSGIVTKIGENVQGEFVIGDKVSVFPLLPCFECASCEKKIYALCSNYDYYGSRRDGGFAEKLNVKKWNLIKLPDSVSLEDGALLEPVAVVLHAIKKMDIVYDDCLKVAIIGAGFLGLIAVQIINKLYPKCKVTLVDRNQFKLDFGKKYRVISQLVRNKESWNNFLSDHENYFDRVVEFAGTPDTFSAALNIASSSSKVIWAGNISDDLILSKSQVSSILRKEISILGTWNSIYKGNSICDWTDSIKIISGGLKPSGLVSSKISLDEVDEVLGKLYNHKKRESKFEVIKVLVKPNG